MKFGNEKFAYFFSLNKRKNFALSNIVYIYIYCLNIFLFKIQVIYLNLKSDIMKGIKFLIDEKFGTLMQNR